MLRKIKSATLLSPRKANDIAEPTISPVKAYGLRPSSPNKPLVAKSSVTQNCPRCQLEICSGCGPVTQDIVKKPRLQSLKSKASAFFRRQPTDAPAGSSSKSDSHPKVTSNQSLALKTSLRSQFDPIGQDAQETLLMLDIETYTLRPRAERKLPATIVIVLDLSVTLLTRRRLLTSRTVAAKLIAFARSGDQIMVITNLKGSDQDRIVIDQTHKEEHSTLELENVLFDMRLESPYYETDTFGALQQGLNVLADRSKRQTAAVLFLSDGAERLTPKQFKLIAQYSQASGVALHTLGIGPVQNGNQLSRLAHCSTLGAYIPVSKMTDLQKVALGISHYEVPLPITEICIDVELFEGASLKEVKDEQLERELTSPQQFSLKIPRLGLFEARHIILSVQIPGCGLTPQPKRSKSDKQGNGSELTNSYRLKELEHLIQSMPGRLAEYTISMRHPALQDDSIARLETRALNIQRTMDDTVEKDPELITQETRRAAIDALLQTQNLDLQRDRDVCLKLLKETELCLFSSCTEMDLPVAAFEDLFAEISGVRFRMSPRFQMTQRKRSYVPKTPDQKESTREQEPSSRSSALKNVITPVRRNEAVAKLQTPHESVHKTTMTTTLSTTITESKPARLRRNSTGNLQANLLDTSTKAVWVTPTLKRLPTSQEVRHIVRKSSSYRDMQSKSIEREASAESDRDDIARTLWRTHKAERGEDSINSELDILEDFKAAQLDASPLNAVLSPGSPKDYFSEKLRLRTTLKTSPLRVGAWTSVDSDPSDYSPTPKEHTPTASRPFLTIAEESEPKTPM